MSNVEVHNSITGKRLPGRRIPSVVLKMCKDTFERVTKLENSVYWTEKETKVKIFSENQT